MTCTSKDGVLMSLRCITSEGPNDVFERRQNKILQQAINLSFQVFLRSFLYCSTEKSLHLILRSAHEHI